MSLRVLVIEDNEELYQYFLRLFENLLDMTAFEFTHVSTIQGALDILEEEWDVVLMDYEMGVAGEANGTQVRNGADLITYRRALEDMASQEGADQNCPKSHIIGTSSSRVCNMSLVKAGADAAYLKLEVPDIAKYLQSWVKILRSI